MELHIPATRTRNPGPKIPPAGKYNATVEKAFWDESEGQIGVKWRWTLNGETWRLVHFLSGDEWAEILADLGFAGQTVQLVDTQGSRARIHVKTYGGRTSARVVEVEPIPAS